MTGHAAASAQEAAGALADEIDGALEPLLTLPRDNRTAGFHLAALSVRAIAARVRAGLPKAAAVGLAWTGPGQCLEPAGYFTPAGQCLDRDPRGAPLGGEAFQARIADLTALIAPHCARLTPDSRSAWSPFTTNREALGTALDGDCRLLVGAVPAGDLPDTPASAADVLRWADEARRTVPHVDIEHARFEEWGSSRIVRAEVTGTRLVITLATGQVFVMTAAEITRPTGLPGLPYTLNPGGQQLTHAPLGVGTLCGQGTPQETRPDWPDVSCLDCRAAEPARPLASFDDLDRSYAARLARDSLAAAAGQPLTTYEVVRQAEPAYRAAIPAALEQMAAEGRAARGDGPDGGQPAWWLT